MNKGCLLRCGTSALGGGRKEGCLRGKSSSLVLAVSSLRRPLDIWETVGKAEVREEVRAAQ